MCMLLHRSCYDDDHFTYTSYDGEKQFQMDWEVKNDNCGGMCLDFGKPISGHGRYNRMIMR